MTENRKATRESTLLAVIAQALAGGARKAELAPYINELSFEGSREMVDELEQSLKRRARGSRPSSSLHRWTDSLARR
jgi:hypothetical protein